MRASSGSLSHTLPPGPRSFGCYARSGPRSSWWGALLAGTLLALAPPPTPPPPLHAARNHTAKHARACTHALTLPPSRPRHMWACRRHANLEKWSLTHSSSCSGAYAIRSLPQILPTPQSKPAPKASTKALPKFVSGIDVDPALAHRWNSNFATPIFPSPPPPPPWSEYGLRVTKT